MSASIEQIWNIVASRKSIVKKAAVPEKGPYEPARRVNKRQ